MNIWSVLCDWISLSPEQEIEYHNMCVEYGYIDPTPAEQAQMDWEDMFVYLDHMPVETEVWYDGEYTGYYQYYKTDHAGNRHYEPRTYSFYAGHTGEYSTYIQTYDGEVVDDYKPVYMRLQGNEY